MPDRKTIAIVMAKPIPGMCRPTRATKSGWARPSTNLNSHHSTFTVMTMGTRMTRPAMNLLRSRTVSLGLAAGTRGLRAGLEMPLGLDRGSIAGILSPAPGRRLQARDGVPDPPADLAHLLVARVL